MVELNDEARGYLTGDDAVAALMSQYGSPTIASTTSAIDYGLPLVVAGLKRRAEDSAGIVNLLNLVRSLDTSQLGTNAMWSRTSHRNVMGPDLTEIVFRDGSGQGTHETVIAKLAERARIDFETARGILGSCTWMLLAVLVNRYSRSLDRQTLLRVADEERRRLSEQGWDPWIRAVEWETNAVTGNETLYVDSVPTPPNPTTASAADRSGRYPPPVSRGDRGDTPGPVFAPEPSSQGRRPDGPEPGGAGGGVGLGGYAPPERPSRGPAPITFGGGRGPEFPDPRLASGRRRPMTAPQPAHRHTRPRPSMPEPNPRRWPIAVAVVAVLLLAGGAWWLIGRDDDTLVDSAQGEPVDSAAAPTGDETASDEAAGDTTDGAAAETGNYTGIVTMEVPMRDIFTGETTNATGTVNFTIDANTGEACALVSTDAVSSPYAAHIHLGSYRERGPVVVNFGDMTDGVENCVANDLDDINEILADRSEYYGEMHDVGGEYTVRGQLSEADPFDDRRDPNLIPEIDSGTAAFDTDPDPLLNGARVRFEGSTLVATGEVDSQEVLDALISSLEASGVTVVNELIVVPGSPPPSGRFVATDGLTFAVGSDQLEGDNSAVLETMAKVLAANPGWKLTVAGHTDNTGTKVDNLELSQRRAITVRQALEDLGVATDVLKIAGYGPEQPVGDNNTPEGRRRNRRIEFVIDPT
ncbi:MAG: OmpA family protein [Acidimicrobiia bacterium]|nr:OmpA family protein [Acidimicrobiia bacterium]